MFKPIALKEVNSRNLKALQPYKCLSGSLIQFPSERWEYINDYLLSIGCCVFQRGDIVSLVFSSDTLPIHCLENEEPFGNSKSTIAKQTPSSEEVFLQQLHTASLWAFNFEEWYSSLSPVYVYTKLGNRAHRILPEACFIPLQRNQVTFIRRCLKKRLWYVTQYSEEEQEKIAEIENKIDVMIRAYSNSDFDGFFVRMSGHSPKDVNQPLKVKSGKEVMNLILRSGRVLIDLEILRKFLFPKKYQNIILIPWHPKMETKMEFRCFVYQGSLNAISQYEYSEVYKEFQNENMLLSIRDAILHFFMQIRNTVRYNSYVFDVFLLENEELSNNDWLIHLIELNPFFGDLSSGSCLFDWESDRDILLCNENLPTLRVRKNNSEALQLGGK